MWHYRNAVISAGALVLRNDRLLLAQRAQEPHAGAWDIPGGFCEENELPADAARREVLEEAGVEIRVGEVLGMWLDTYERPGQPTRTTLNVYFLAALARDDQKPHAAAEELLAVEWFDEAAIPAANLAFPSSTRPAINAAFAVLAQQRSRHH